MITAEDREFRRSRVGSSDAAAILGIDPFRTIADVYWEKAGPAIPDKPNKSFELGNRLEALLCDWAADRLGVEVRKNVSLRPENSIFAANLDGAVVGPDGQLIEGVEAKYDGDGGAWGDEGTDQIPDRVIVQCQHQCHVGNFPRVWVPAFICAPGRRAEFRLYCVTRNEDLIQIIIAAEEHFWREHVLARVPPDGSAPPVEVLKAIHRQPKSIVALDDSAIAALDAFEDAKAAAGAAEGEKERCYGRVLELLGEAEAGRLPDGRTITYLEQKSAPRVDAKLLRALAPEIHDRVVSQGAHRVLRVKKAA